MTTRSRRLVFLIGFGALFVVITMWWWILAPGQGEVSSRADAVVMFVGGRGERLELATAVFNDEEIPNLVIPNGDQWPAANKLCSAAAPTVFCPTPDPDTTKGEAQAIAALAETNDWESVVLVTSDYHRGRAHLLLSGTSMLGSSTGRVEGRPLRRNDVWQQPLIHGHRFVEHRRH